MTTAEVDGKLYQFSFPGGGYVSFEALMELFGVAENNSLDNVVDESQAIFEDEQTEQDVSDPDEPEKIVTRLMLSDVTVSEETKKFVADVESVEFSKPDLVWVGKAETETTVKVLKEKNNLKVQYSAELTAEEIKAINAQTVEEGDWALISLLPFRSEEMLTVTMKTGEVFHVRVTDATGTVWNGGADTRSQGITVNLFVMARTAWIKRIMRLDQVIQIIQIRASTSTVH